MPQWQPDAPVWIGKTDEGRPWGRPSHCWLVTFFWAIIFRVNRSPSTVSW